MPKLPPHPIYIYSNVKPSGPKDREEGEAAGFGIYISGIKPRGAAQEIAGLKVVLIFKRKDKDKDKEARVEK